MQFFYIFIKFLSNTDLQVITGHRLLQVFRTILTAMVQT